MEKIILPLSDQQINILHLINNDQDLKFKDFFEPDDLPQIIWMELYVLMRAKLIKWKTEGIVDFAITEEGLKVIELTKEFLRKMLCMDCGIEIFGDVNMVMIKDSLWGSIAPNHSDTFCDKCIEKKLGRQITPEASDCLPKNRMAKATNGIARNMRQITAFV